MEKLRRKLHLISSSSPWTVSPSGQRRSRMCGCIQSGHLLLRNADYNSYDKMASLMSICTTMRLTFSPFTTLPPTRRRSEPLDTAGDADRRPDRAGTQHQSDCGRSWNCEEHCQGATVHVVPEARHRVPSAAYRDGPGEGRCLSISALVAGAVPWSRAP